MMKIGDEVYIHGYVDEIRNDTVIIKNEGGYFGTVEKEILPAVEINGEWIPIEKPDVPFGLIFQCDRCGFTLSRIMKAMCLYGKQTAAIFRIWFMV